LNETESPIIADHPADVVMTGVVVHIAYTLYGLYRKLYERRLTMKKSRAILRVILELNI
jgi:hypothetical protein